MKQYTKLRTVLFCILLACSTCCLLAQDETPTAVTVQNRSGDLPFSSSVGSEVEHVDLMSGNLTVNIPISHVPGRGIAYNFNLLYDARWLVVATRGGPTNTLQLWNVERRFYVPDNGFGWQSNQPSLTYISHVGDVNSDASPCTLNQSGPQAAFHRIYNTGNFIFSDSSSAKHPLILNKEDGSACVPSFMVTNDKGPDQTGAGLWADNSRSLGSGAPTINLADGTALSPSGCTLSIADGYLCSYVSATDVHGNQSQFGPGGTDSIGRVNVTQSSATNQIIYTVYDAAGNPRNYTVNYAPFQIATAFNAVGFDGAIAEYSGTRNAITSVVLPDNTSYTFQYDNYGGLTQLTLPTGAVINYGWSTFGTADGTIRYVSSRTATVNGVVSRWLFARSTIPDHVVVTVTDPANNQSVYTSGDTEAVVGDVKIYNGSATGTPLREYQIAYRPDDTDSSPILPTSVTTTLDNGLVSKKEFDYDTFNYNHYQCIDPTSCPENGPTLFSLPESRGNVISIREYGFGQGAPGPLLRTTTNKYLADLTDNPSTGAQYAAQNIVSKIIQQTITDSVAGTTAADTKYEYDNLTTSGPFLGDATSVKRWRNTDNAWLPTTYSYDQFGNITSITDPGQHTTQWSYADLWASSVGNNCVPAAGSNVYPSLVTNAKQQRLQITHFPCTGQVEAHQDENDLENGLAGILHTYDLLNRPLTITDVLGGQTSFSYPNATTVIQSKKITSALSDSSTSLHDGLGRVIESQHVLPNGTALVDTTYDLVGHAATVTNPYFSTSDPTYGATSSQYDGMGRVTQTTKQDGSISRVKYDVITTLAVNADCTITTDEAGNQRGACTDALGRLAEVDEPNPGTTPSVSNYATMQTDGNFVLYSSSNSELWSSGTSGSGAGSVMMQDDGNLVLYIFKWSAGTYAAPSPGPFAPQSCSIGTYLIAGQSIHANQCIVSPHGQYMLYMDPNGNFYIYDIAHGTGTWGANTYGHPGAYALMQGDGNLVIYDANNNFLWMSGTNGTNAERLDMEDDGRIIIYKSAWNSGTSTGQFNWTQLAHPGCDAGTGTGWTGILGAGQCFVSPNGHFALSMQTDGNLVLYDESTTPITALWMTNTPVSPADPAVALRTLYTYDVLGNLTCVEQHGDSPAGPHNDGTGTAGTGCSASPSSDAISTWRVRRFSYDSLGRILTAENPESGTISYVYDNDGNVLQKTSPAPNQTGTATETVSYCYDELHRVLAKGYSASPNPAQQCLTASPWLPSPAVVYAYDSSPNAKGKLVSMTDQAGTATYAYDVLQRLASETRTLTGTNNTAISNTISYEYNLDGSLSKLHYPGGRIVAYTPWNNGSIAVSIPQDAKDLSNGTNYISGATYGPDMSLVGFLSGSGGAATITNSFSYNKRLQPVSMSASTPGATVFSIGYDFHFGNGDNGDVYGITNYKDQTRNQTFTYDALNRLITAQNTGTDCTKKTLNPNQTEYWGNSYTYDAWGNLTHKVVKKCSAEGLNRTGLINNQLSGYGYDAAGNMTNDGIFAYSFDPENRLIGAHGYTYMYDGDGNRVGKTTGTTGTLYWYMTPGVLAETDLSGNNPHQYVFFNGERVARIDSNGLVYYYFSDHLKTASVITDSAGGIRAESDYYPWGGELQLVANDSNHYKFTSKERDSETSLDYFGARYYSNALGRFMTADLPFADQHKADPQTWNLYMYARNNPLRNIDPNGRGIIDIAALVQSVSNWWHNSGSQELHDVGVGSAKMIHNWAANAATHGIFPPPAVIGETSGLTDLSGRPVLETPSNTPEKIGYYGTAAAPLVLGAAGGLLEGPEIVELTNLRIPSVIATGTRYVGDGEAAEIANTGLVPNVNLQGEPKPVFYTPESPMNSASAAQQAYQLPSTPTHAVELDTSGVHNTYGGNVENGNGVELITHDKIPATKITKLDPN